MTPKRAAAEESEARCYAILIRSGQAVDWASLNREIVARWSLSALMRVKHRAWSLIEAGEIR